MKILTADQIRRIDRLSTENYGVPSILLMENAGIRVVEALDARIEDLDSQSILILCGKGNNGGDGMVVARQLIQRGVCPAVFLFSPADEVSGDARVNLDILTALGFPPVVVRDAAAWDTECSRLTGIGVVVDALLGTGLTRSVGGLLAHVIASIEDRFLSATIVSVDVPSGCAADTGDVTGVAVEADLTVTFSGLKHCLVFPPASLRAGEVVVADIGNPHDLLDSVEDPVTLLDRDAFPEAGFPRDCETHKGDYGKVLVVGGSAGKAGAAAMAAQAALRAGAGLVTAAVPSGVQAVVSACMAEIMTEALPEGPGGMMSSDAFDRVVALVPGKSVVALGPGIGRGEEISRVVRDLVRAIGVPIVLDADGINAFAGRAEELSGRDRTADRAIVVTPHPGEMSRLLDMGVPELVRDRLSVARDFAVTHRLFLVLKGFRTVIATPSGEAFVAPTGNPGMATAGSGDVLTGMIAGILAQPHLGTFVERLCLAVYLHGLAGDIGAGLVGEEALVATDLLAFLPEAWSELRDL